MSSVHIDIFGSATPIPKLGIGRVRSVAERFVLGSFAAAQGHVIANFVGLVIGANKRDSSAHPQRAAASLRRIFDYPIDCGSVGSIGLSVSL